MMNLNIFFLVVSLIANSSHARVVEENADVVSEVQERAGILDPNRRWPHGVVPFVIKENTYNEEEKKIILSGIKEIEIKTCIKFKNRAANDKDFISIEAGVGCSSMVGRVGGAQQLSLDKSGCVQKHVVIHELLHALGLHHQQCAENRDKYVKIHFDNIIVGREHNFVIQRDTSDFGVGYEYGSLMHYGRRFFAKDTEKDTITPLEVGAVLGGNIFTEKDILKIRKMYNCK